MKTTIKNINLSLKGSLTISDAYTLPTNSGGLGDILMSDGVGGVSWQPASTLAITTDDVTEASNLYYTNERVDDRVSALIQNGIGINWTYNDPSNTLTGNVTLTPFSTDDLSEGSNLYYTNERVDDRVSILIQDNTGISWSYSDVLNTLTPTINISAFTTDDLPEGSTNLYFTNEAIDDRVSTLIQNGIGINWTYNDPLNTLTGNVTLAPFSTDDLSEGGNLYYTDERVDDRVSSLVQDSATITWSYNDILNTLTANAVSTNLVEISKNGASVASQPEINFIEGSDISLSIVNDGANNRVNVTVSNTAVTGQPGTLTTIANDGVQIGDSDIVSIEFSNKFTVTENLDTFVQVDIDMSINDLIDVSSTSPVLDWDVIKYNSTLGIWENGSISELLSIDQLSDVTISSPQDGDGLIYNSVSGEWENTYIPQNLSDLGDMSISSPAQTGDILMYNATLGIWENIEGVLSSLLDVSSLTPLDLQALRYNALSGLWQPYDTLYRIEQDNATVKDHLTTLNFKGSLQASTGLSPEIVDVSLDTSLISISEFSDISIASPIQDGESLIYNSTLGIWENGTPNFDITVIQIDSVTQNVGTPTLDFSSSDFNLTEGPADVFNVTINDSGINHDSTTGYVANEHIDHSTVFLTSGTGLSGGGDLTSSRTLNLDIDGLTALSDANLDILDTFAIYNNSTGTHEKATVLDMVDIVSNSLGLSPINGIVYTSSNWIDNNDGTITLPTVEAVLYDDQEWTGSASTYTVTGGTTGSGLTALTDESTNYIYVDYNAGSPQFVITTSEPDYKRSDRAKYITLYRAGNFLHILDWGFEASGLSNKLLQRVYETNKFQRASGLALSAGGNDDLQVNIEAGDVWNGIHREITPDINSWDDTFFSNYHTAGVWDRSVLGIGSGTANNTHYDNGTDLVALGNGKYVVNWYYKGVEDDAHVYEVIGRGEYNSVAAAQLETPPPVPELIESHAILVGRFICQEGVTSPAAIESAFENQFAATSVTSHNDLSGLQGGTGGEYFHLTNSEHTYLTTSTFAEGTGSAGKVALWSGTNTVTYDNDISWSNSSGDPVLSITGSTFNSVSSIGSGTISHSVDGYAQFFMNSFSNSNYPIMQMQRRLGTRLAPIDITAGSTLGVLRWSGGYGIGARIKAVSRETHTIGQSGSRLDFETTQNGSTSPQVHLSINEDGKVSVGNGTAFGSNSKMYVLSDATDNQTTALEVNNTAPATVTVPRVAILGASNAVSSNRENIGGYFLASNNSNANHAVQLVDGSEAAGRFLKSIDANGRANWADITAADVSGAIGGSGTADYIPRWTPDGVTLGDSLIRDDGNTIGIGVAPNAAYKLNIESSTGTIGIRSLITNNGGSGIYGISNGTGASANTGILGIAHNSSVLNIGVRGDANISSTGDNIGGYFFANGGSGNYSVQLKDGTESVGGGKFLKDTGDGKANWANITASDISGLGTYAKVGTYTDGYVPRWNSTANTLESGLIRDDGSTIGINTTPIGVAKLFIQGTGTAIGTWNRTQSSSATTTYGSVSENLNTSGTTYGLEGRAIAVGTGTRIGGWFRGSGGSLNYSLLLQDGTEGSGKFLKSVTSSGYANWANITASDVSGVVSGSGTADYIPRWTPDGVTLGDSLIRDNGSRVSIGAAPTVARKLYVVTSSDVYAISGQNQSTTGLIIGTHGTSTNPSSTDVSYGVVGSAGTSSITKPSEITVGDLVGVSGSALDTSTSGKLVGLLGAAQSSSSATGDVYGIYSYIAASTAVNAYALGVHLNSNANPVHNLGIVVDAQTGFYSDTEFVMIDSSGVFNFSNINDLSADSTPDRALDYVMTWDASAGLHKKVLIEDLGGTVNGSGTTDYVPRWTPDGVTLGDSLIRDDGTSVAIGGNPPSDSKVLVYSTSANANKYSLRVGNNGNSTTLPNIAIYGYANGTTSGSTSYSAGGRFTSSANDNINYGVIGESTPASPGSAENIGGYFRASNGSSNHAVQLIDGTETVAGGKFLKDTGDGKANWASIPYDLPFACGDESTPITVATDLVTLRSPRAFNITNVKASLTVAGSTSGTTTIDVKVNGTSIFSTLLTIDFGETTSATAAVAAVLSTTSISDDDEITVDVTAVSGGATEAGLKIYIIGELA